MTMASQSRVCSTITPYLGVRGAVAAIDFYRRAFGAEEVLRLESASGLVTHAEIPVLGVIENMSHYRCPACGHVDHLFAAGGGRRLASDFDLPLLGELPLEGAISTSGELGNPIVSIAPDSDNTRVFLSVAANVGLAAAKLQGVGPIRSSLLRTV